MVKKTLELYECDRCGKDAKRYSVSYEDGTLVLDRCETHNKKLEALREEKGEWLTPRSGKASFQKSTVAEVRQAVEEARRRSASG